MGQRNPAPPKGWLKPKENNGMCTTYQVVIRISLAHPLYLYGWGNSPAEPPKEFGQVARILTFHKPNRCRGFYPGPP